MGSEEDYIRVHKLNLEYQEEMQTMNGIIDVLWAEVKENFRIKMIANEYSNEEIDEAWQKYQCQLCDKAREER